ncbi:MAG: hypothetical protein WD118_09250 [Phycisphaeraceae bacterium]
MPDRLRDASTWVTLVTLLLTLLVGGEVVVYCVGPGDHAAIEFAHGQQSCDPQPEGDAGARPDRANITASSTCADQPLMEASLVPFVSASPQLVVAIPAPLRYELPDLKAVDARCPFSRWQVACAHPDVSVVQSVILLI